jgi:hypothetical protein
MRTDFSCLSGIVRWCLQPRGLWQRNQARFRGNAKLREELCEKRRWPRCWRDVAGALRINLLNEGDVPGRDSVDYDHLGADVSAAFGLGTPTLPMPSITATAVRLMLIAVISMA